MAQPHKCNYRDEAELLGDWHPLVDQLGSAQGLVTLSAVSRQLQLARVRDFGSLREFLEVYQTHVLIPIELPAIQRAFLHASRHQTRELIEDDQRLATEPLLREFAAASQRVGQCHLRRLRPLRDHRLLQRYLRAVEEGRAHGWHTLVYGLTISIYSLPVRQCLIFYERKTLSGFINSAARTLRLSETDAHRLLDDLCADLPQTLEGEMRCVLGAEASRD
ncbi:MAG TPA: urease accessory UreF family protein [Methylomirabilota bacterium]|nr:urease accessory UreF family protein [Methylomirabilota bacterium]